MLSCAIGDFTKSLIIELVKKYTKEVIVHDMTISCGPNVAETSVNVGIRWNVEVVIVTSNPEGIRDVLRACKRLTSLPLAPFGTLEKLKKYIFKGKYSLLLFGFNKLVKRKPTVHYSEFLPFVFIIFVDTNLFPIVSLVT
ncbi:hypothetical protein CR513_50984, partial [Mucuna pruriens]